MHVVEDVGTAAPRSDSALQKRKLFWESSGFHTHRCFANSRVSRPLGGKYSQLLWFEAASLQVHVKMVTHKFCLQKKVTGPNPNRGCKVAYLYIYSVRHVSVGSGATITEIARGEQSFLPVVFTQSRVSDYNLCSDR